MHRTDDGRIDHEHSKAQLERMAFFSDAVFAIAMTLLVVEVKLPHIARFDDVSLANALLAIIPSYVGFLVSFLVLARFWVSHHVVLGELRPTNTRLLWANLMLLLAVAFIPFPTAVVAEYAQLRVGVGFYAVWLVLLGLLNQRIIRIGISDPARRRQRRGSPPLPARQLDSDPDRRTGLRGRHGVPARSLGRARHRQPDHLLYPAAKGLSARSCTAIA
ncbi:TMEM175 family protein [Sphingomonas floccifaciens]|uniref:TMEM175 family protein n=1 Tax=Sphingomonas floccifaciens TaxID=1844115 RepID=A0ABW4NJ93_9SPHN